MNEKQESKVLSNFDMFANEILYDTKHIGFVESFINIYCRETKDIDYEYTRIVEWLAKPYKEPIKVTKLWYDILQYLFKPEERNNLTGNVNDYHFMNRFIQYIPEQYQNIPMVEYLDRLEVE